jgi:hypothetical protein
LPRLVNIPEILYYCGVITDESNITYHLENGDELTFNGNDDYRETQIMFAQDFMNSMWLKNRNRYYWFETIDNSTLYVQYNKCENDPEYPFKKYVNDIDSLFKTQTINKLCIDLRLNAGGSSMIIKPLINRIKQQKGLKTYTFISRGTFSSAIEAVVDCKEDLGATLIGEPTGGCPNSYGDMRSFQLPNSRAVVFYPTEFFSKFDTNENSIHPDIEIKYESEKYLKGIDPVLEYALNN